jgi:DNA-binding winged helix-turn-helix (wHTH) protein
VAPGSYRFDPFVLDLADRRLRRDGAPVELNARYLDALALLVREQGTLVTKDRFLDEVWSGVPVTDEALTQCIKTLRRQLGDDAARPRFIETVPKHGYRFIAAVEPGGGSARRALPRVDTAPWRRPAILGAAGTAGGGMAGLVGGLVYGLAASAQPQPGLGAVSVLLILVCLTVAIALLGAAGVAFGIAAGQLAPAPRWQGTVAGGAIGGFAVGAVVKLVGLDAFELLLGQPLGDITGPKEGVALGAAVGFAAWLAWRYAGNGRLRRAMALGALVGGTAGATITALGGELMAGSLDLLVRGLPHSRLRLEAIGELFGESGFGPVSRVATGALEGALFAAGIVGAMIVAERKLVSADG